MAATVLQGDVHVAGTLTATDFVPAAGSVTNASVDSGAGIEADKLQQQHVLTHKQNSTPAAATEIVHIVNGATAEVQSFKIMTRVVPTGADSYTVDLKKNGSSILTAVLPMTSAKSANTEYAATFSNDDLVDGDYLHVVVGGVSGATLGTGLIAQVVINEDPV